MRLWMVALQDKELYMEPDVGLCFVESDDEQAANDAGAAMQFSAMTAGRCRCVFRYREIERGFKYRSTALLRTPSL